MKPLLRAATALLFLFSAQAAAAPDSTSTCFSHKTEGEIAVWVFEETDSWRQAKQKPEDAKVLLFVLPRKTGRFSVSDSRYCVRTWQGNGRSYFTGCASGTFELSEFEPARHLSGSYRLVLEDGSVRDRAFEAEHCSADPR